VIGVTTDVLFPVWQQRELAEYLGKRRVDVDFVELDAPYGHDTFLIDRERVGGAVRGHLAGEPRGE
jgi:homoserine O-acetyltransferase